MMTTASKQVTAPATGGGVLLGAAGLAAAAGLALTAVGAVAAGSAGALGALAGTAIVVGVMLMGAASVDVVAGLAPQFALLFALLTYLLQVLALALVFVILQRSGVLESDLDRRWLGGAAIAAVLGWTAGHVALATRRRIPVYDLPAATSSAASSATSSEASVDRSADRIQAGER